MAKQRAHHGEPPLSWLWDYYPLARDAWGNVLGFNDGSGDGHIIRMRMWLRAAPMSNFPPPVYRPAQAPLPPMFQDGGSRDCYIPTDADMALVKRLFGDVADAGNPPWPQIAARLIAAGQDRDKLATYNAPTLLLLLAEAEGMNAGGNGGTSARKPGKGKGDRPKVTAAEANTTTDAGQAEDREDLSPSRVKARALHDWAMECIPGAERMTRTELYNAIKARLEAETAKAHGRQAELLAELCESLPPNAEAFGKYLRDAGIKVYNSRGDRHPTRSIRRRDQI
jgi:hypothetical protein